MEGPGPIKREQALGLFQSRIPPSNNRWALDPLYLFLFVFRHVCQTASTNTAITVNVKPTATK
jgi:hypothetical protein